jgi:hypothetical protein
MRIDYGLIGFGNIEKTSLLSIKNVHSINLKNPILEGLFARIGFC